MLLSAALNAESGPGYFDMKERHLAMAGAFAEWDIERTAETTLSVTEHWKEGYPT
jgi:hypothetical protein